MSKIPYFFETPIPTYFRENGWFKNPKTRLFVTWGFERCSNIERTVLHDGQNLTLKPYQFIFGRKICADELGLTESEVRNQVNNLVNAGFLKNATNSTTKRYSIYEWLTTSFSKHNDQVNNQVTTKWRPSNNHNLDNQISDNQKDCLTDGKKIKNKLYDIGDLMASESDKKNWEHNIYYQDHPQKLANNSSKKLFVARCKQDPGVISIPEDQLIQTFISERFSEEEIFEALEKFKEQNPVLSGKTRETLQKYIRIILENQRKEQCAKRFPKKNSRNSSKTHREDFLESGMSENIFGPLMSQLGLSNE